MQIQINLDKYLYSYFSQYKGLLKFLLRFSMFFLVFILVQWLMLSTSIMDSLLNTYARLIRFILLFLGFQVQVSGNIVFQPDGFAILISPQCLAVTHTLAIVAAILAYKAAIHYKIAAISISIFIVQMINIFRMVTVYSIGIYHREWFDLVHDIIWKPAMIILIIIILLLVLNKAHKKRSHFNYRSCK